MTATDPTGSAPNPKDTPMTTPADSVHRDAVAVTAFRELPTGAGRAYSTSDFPAKRAGIVALFMQAQACGLIKESTPDHSYALLDLLDSNDDVVQTWDIPTADAFRWWKRKLHLRVESTDDLAAVTG